MESVTQPFVSTVFEPYAGYLHTLPRLCAELVSVLPVEWAAAGLAISAAWLRAAVALIVFAASGGVLRSLPVRLALAALVIVLPAGNTETLNNVANVRWFLLYGVFWALLWRPPSRWQRVLAAVFVALSAASTPLAFFLAPIALLRLTLPGWRDRMITVAYVLGSVAQAGAVLFSSGRPKQGQPFDSEQVVLAAVYRGPLVALTGSEQVVRLYPRFGHWPALAAVVVFAVPVVFALIWGSPAHRFVAVGLHGLVMGANLVANWHVPLQVQHFMVVVGAQRYSIAPCLFFFAAMAVGLDALPQPRWARLTVPATRSVVAVAVVVSICLHATVPAGRVQRTALGGRLDGAPWGPSVAKARESCARGEPVGRVAQEP